MSSFTLSYTVADDAGNQSSAFLDVRIVPRRRGQPAADRPHRHRPHAQRRAGVAIAAVANDSDPDGDIIAVESIRTPADRRRRHASRPARVVYTPSDTFAGTDRFTYSLVDAGGEIAIGEVLVGVMPLPAENRAPEAFDDRVRGRRRQRAARVRRPRQRLRPRRRHASA